MAWFSLMQHYRAPTRLLDWTRSAFVAAYFAVESDFDQPGFIWVIHPATVKAFTEKTYGQRELPDDEGEQLLTAPDAKPLLFFVRRPRETNRMAAQQGFFSVSPDILADHGDLLADAVAWASDHHERFFAMIIPPRLKPEFLRRLVAMNITARALFPGVDGLGRTVAELVTLAILHRKEGA